MDIGLVGYAGSGKDTVADILCAEYGYRRIAFADPVREMALALNPWIPDYETTGYTRYSYLLNRVGYERAKKNPQVRELLQRLGTEAGRHILGEDIWVKTAMKRATELGEAPVVFTDCRFDNEVAAIRRHGGRIILVTRPGVHAPNTHSSESLPLTVIPDLTIGNEADLDTLRESVRSAMEILSAPALG